jgi:glycolate oxidase
MAVADLTRELVEILPPGAVLSDPGGLFVYESDGFTVPGRGPAAVVFPTTTEEVVRVVKLLAERDVQIVPRGSGTGWPGGAWRSRTASSSRPRA